MPMIARRRTGSTNSPLSYSLVPAAAFICSVVFFALGMNPAAFISFAGSVGFVIPRIIEAFKSGKASKNEDKPKSEN